MAKTAGSDKHLKLITEIDQPVVSRIVHDSHNAANRYQLGPDWADRLPRNFYKHRERFELKLKDRLKVDSTAAIDVALRTGAGALLGSTALPLGFHPAGIREMLASRDLYEPVAEKQDPELFFKAPPRGVQVRRSPAFAPLFNPKDGICEDLTFLSPYEPFNPGVRNAYLRHKANSVAHARYWHHESGPRPTILVVHGFMADAAWVNEWMFEFRWLYEKLGCDIVLFTLPFHGYRQTRFSPFSGHGFFAGGLSRINEAFGQGVFDLRILMNYLEDEVGVSSMGITGISLGGYTSALMAGVESRLQFSVPNVPVASIADLVLEWEPAGTMVRGLMKAINKDITDIRRMLAVASPLNYQPLLDRDRLLIIGGVADRLAPPQQTVLLWEHWNRCRIHWFPGSHILHLDKGTYLRQFARFLSRIGFLDKKK